jgi:hypothetical protein
MSEFVSDVSAREWGEEVLGALFSGGGERGRLGGVLPKPRLENELDKVMGHVGPPGDEAA